MPSNNKLVFRNSGLLKLPVEVIYQGGNSKALNPKIQNMLRMIGFGENVGSGFPKIIAAWNEANWGEPELKNKLDVDEVELVLPVPTPTHKSYEVSGEVSKGLSETAFKICMMILSDNSISRKELVDKTDISKTAVQKHLNKLKQLGVIIRVGSPKFGLWEFAQ